jgi:S-DNA-T family DNA segregation ATPase FtsK/SpoIIIE
MDTNELIGRVAAAYLKQRVSETDPSTTARYLLDSLSPDQTVAIAQAILADSVLEPQIEVKLPHHWVGDYGLPARYLTAERATFYRNSPCDRPALLLATPGDDEQQSLADLTIIDTNQLKSLVDIWVRVASHDLTITDQHRRWWVVALAALQDVTQVSLDRFALYVLEARKLIEDGSAFLDAIGGALPALRWPKNAALFHSLTEKSAGQPSKWKALFNQVCRRQACYLRKYTPTNQLLSTDDLRSAFDRVKEEIPEPLHETIRSFINSSSNWNTEAEALAQTEWEIVRPLFDGLKPERFNLGRATLEFYEELEEDRLSKEEQAYLRTLAERRRASDPIEEDIAFYTGHRDELKQEPNLKAKWDKFIFGSPIETSDFVVGLALCLESLFDRNISGLKRTLIITTDKRTRRDLKKLNVHAGRYFAFRYRGLDTLLGRAAFDVGQLFEFDKVYEGWTADRRYKANYSNSRAALEIKFYVAVQFGDGAEENHRQLIWRFDPNSIISELHSDWAERLVEHPLMMGTATRGSDETKGMSQPLDLRDVRSLSAAFGQDRGSLIPTYRREHDLEHIWHRSLADAEQRGSVSKPIAALLGGLFDGFAESYRMAIKRFALHGVSCPEINLQYVAYAKLLEALCIHAKGDRNRELLLKPILAIGTVPVAGGAPAAIVAPWNPLRMQAMSLKANRIAQLLRHLLHAENVLFGDAGLYFKEMRDELEHPYFPEVALGWRQRKAELLGLSDSYMDYTLHELPLAGPEGNTDTNENPTESANKIVDIIQRYLALFPHEEADLSAVLYNCDSAALPQAVVNKINDVNDDESDMRCEVILRHRDRAKLQKLYETILESGDTDTDGFVSSEASRDFMARLRIGIMADEAPPPDPKDGPRADLVFLHDVIARHARLEWYMEDATPVSLLALVPARWSRRRPSPIDEEKSIVYLCSPGQSAEGWSYITAVTTYFKGDWDGDFGRRLLPARQLDFNDPETAEIFKESHNLGNWVVNFDELLDRRQLVNQGVKVIRFKQATTQGRNLLVSSTASLGLLHSMLQHRLKDLLPEMTDDQVRVLSQKFIDDANRISGDIVLRAAKRGKNASELMGVVLSYFVTMSEVASGNKSGCYFLDDYSEWLGQPEQQIADLLILCPEVLASGERRLTVLVTESKYIQEESLGEKRRESQKQIRDTLRRVEEALFGTLEHLDRDLWLSRFSDLLLSGVHYSAGDDVDIAGFRRALREGNCSILLRGYSHIFVSGPADGSECSDFVKVSGLNGAYQEVYSRSKTRSLVAAYANNISPDSVRFSVVERSELGLGDFRAIVPLKPLWIGDTVFKKSEGADSDKELEGNQLPENQVDDVSPTGPREFTDGPGKSEPSVSSPDSTEWAYPTIERVLVTKAPVHSDTPAEKEWLAQTVIKTRTALQEFQLHSKLIDKRLTPNSGILRFQGAPNLTVELVLRRRSEFLTTHGLNIIAVRGEPGAVVLSIARPSRQILYTLDVWKGWAPHAAQGNHRLLVGVREDDGQPLFISPTENAPHTLIAGSTGSGKSVLMQNIVLGIACTNAPEQARIVLIDPKRGVDYFSFDGLPHLSDGIIEDQETAIQKLNNLIIEMDRRYAVLKENRCSSIFDLNRKQNPTERFACLWVIHDEFAEWMMTDEYRDTVSKVVSRLGVKARAAGIFLVFAAQRPDSNVMPLQLRSNLGNRLILRVDSEGTSEIALGERGAERLLGRGHMIAKLEGDANLIYSQVPLVSAGDIEQLVYAIRTSATSTKGIDDSVLR